MARTYTYIRTTSGHQHAQTWAHETTSAARGCGGRTFLAELSDGESVPEFLLDSTKMHPWADGSEIRGRAGFLVFDPHAQYDSISEPIVGPQTNNRVEVSAFRAGFRAVHNNQEMCLYSDCK